jgi:sugar lactone lactonase YvrE
MQPTITQPSAIRRRDRFRFGVVPAAVLALTMIASGSPALAAPATSQPNAGGTQLVTVPGSISRLASSRTRVQLGYTAATQPLMLELSVRGRDPAGLQQFLQQVNRHGSPLYRHYLTPAQYTQRFGPDPQALATVTTFLHSSGLAISQVYSGGQLITLRTTVGQAEQVFHMQLYNYRAPRGYTYYAADHDPLLPASVATLVSGISGLDSAARPQHHPVRAAAAVRHPGPHALSGPPSNSGGFTPSQVQTAYDVGPLLAGGQTGAGRAVDLFEFDGFQQSYINTFDSYYGRTSPVPVVIPVNNGVTALSSGENEVELDIEVLQGMAPKVGINVYEGPVPSSLADFFSSYAAVAQTIAAAHDADVASASWGWCETDWDPSSRAQTSQAFAQMAAEGMDAFIASGDTGSADCQDANGNPVYGVDYPASDPNVTAVGGTTLTVQSDGSYGGETVWDGYGAGGGGISGVFPMLAYQQGPGVNNSYSDGNREVPDVSAAADPLPGYDTFTDDGSGTGTGAWIGFGGTSAAAPLWATVVELTDEYALSRQQPTNGFVNPALYALAAGTPPYPPFHDVTVGDNDPLSPKHNPVFYPATSGYDMASGLGSPDAYNLARDLSASPTSCSTPPATLPATGLNGPTDVAVDAHCDIFIADAGNNRVVELPASGGQFTVASGLNAPLGVVVDSAGSLYIADTGNKRVLKLTAGSSTPVPMQLTGLCGPARMAIDNAGNLYIADYCGGQVVKVTPTGAQSTVGAFYNPYAVAVDSAGNLYVASFDGNQVIKVAPNGSHSVIGINLYGPDALAVDAAGTVYISDYFHARVVAVTAAGVQFRLPLTGLNHPGGLALDSTGTLYLADYSNNRVLTASNPGVNASWTASGFSGPEGVAVDAQGNTFISDSVNNRIVEINAAGVHTTVPGATSLDQPDGVAVNSAGTLYIGDLGNDRVVKVTVAGVESTVPLTGLSSVLGVALASDGTLYVADEVGNQVVKLAPNGTQSPVRLSGLDHPGGVAVDGAGNLYVSNAYSGTVVKLTPGGTQSTVLSGLTFPSVGVASDGTVYASDWGRHQVVRLSAGGVPTTVLAGQLNNPAGVAVGGTGTIYVADYTGNKVVTLTASGTQGTL